MIGRLKAATLLSDIKVGRTRWQHRDRLPKYHRYFMVKYTDGDYIERTIGTYFVVNYFFGKVGRKCLVYDWCGQVIVDAMEKS